MLLFLDVETTGFQPETSELLELAAVRFDGKKVVATFDELIRPEEEAFEIPEIVERLTGISREMVANKPPLSEIRNEFLENFLRKDDVIVGHNISFDTGFLKQKGFSVANEEIDTYPLSTLILPNEESHSLEVLTERYDLPHENAHRALADCLANLEFWKLLQNIFLRDFPDTLRQKYEDVLKKTTWPGKKFFSGLSKSSRGEGGEADQQLSFLEEAFPLSVEVPQGDPLLKTDAEKNEAELRWQEEVSSLLQDGRKALWEVKYSFPLDLLSLSAEVAARFTQATGQQVGVLFHAFHEKKMQQLREELFSLLPGCPCLLFARPESMVCETKWQAFLQKPTFSDVEAMMALKVLRDMNLPDSGTPNLKHEEWSVWPQISSSHHEHCPDSCRGKQMLPENIVHQKGVVFLPHQLLKDYPGKYLLLEDAENLDEVLTDYVQFSGDSRKIRALCWGIESDLSERIVVFFDFLGGFLRSMAGESTYAVTVPARPSLRNQKKWQEFETGISEILETMAGSFSPEENLYREIQIWKDFFSVPNQKNEVCYFSILPDDEVLCFRDMIALDSALENLLSGKKAVGLFGSHFPKKNASDWAFFCDDFPKELEMKSISLSPSGAFPNTIFVPRDNADSENTPRSAALWLMEFLKSTSGNILAQFSSQKSIVEVEECIAPFCAEHDIRLVSHRTGGRGKIQNFLRKPERKIFCGTAAIFAKVFPLPGVDFEVFFFQKFLFAPPGNSLLDARKKSFSDPFQEFSLPRSMAKFEQAFYLLSETQTKPFLFFCLDTRISQNTGFARSVQNFLSAESAVRKIRMGEIAEKLQKDS